MSLSLFDLTTRRARTPIREHEKSYPHAEQQLLVALRALADVCDGASSWDGQGFNKIDAPFCKDIADQAYRMTPKQMNAAYWKVIKYAGQLSNMSLVIPSKEDVAAVIEARNAEYAARQAAKDAARNKVADEVDGEVDYRGGLLHLKFDYNKDANERIHRIQEAIDRLRMLPENDGKGIARVKFDYDNKAWQAPMQAINLIKENFPQFALTDNLVQELRRREEERQARLREQEEKARAQDGRTRETLACLGDLSKPVGRLHGQDIILYKHQQEIIYKAIYKLRYIIAHEVGLGKTLSSLCAAKAITLYEKKHNNIGLHVFVIGQAVKRNDWLTEAAAVGLHIAYFTYEKIPEYDPGVPFVLIVDEAQHMQNLKAQRTKKFVGLSERAHAVFLLTGTPIKNAKPSNIYPLLLAAHHPIAYPRDSRKTQFEKEFCGARVTKYSRWDTSGATALARLNKLIIMGEHACLEYKEKEECVDLPPLLRFKQQVEVSKEASRVYEETVDALWDRYESRVVEKMTTYVEKRKAEFLQEQEEKGVPENERVELDVKSFTFRMDLEDEEARIRQGVALIALGIARHAGELAKLEAVVEHATDFIDSGKHPIIFCNFKDTAEEIAIRLSAYITDIPQEIVRGMHPRRRPVKLISGDYTGDVRDGFIKEFQKGDAEAIVCMFGAGGAGINLQKGGSRMILASRPWTPGEVTQAEGRIHRIGQVDDSVVVLWEQLPKSLSDVDIKIDEVLEKKQKNIKLTLQGKEEEEAIVFEPVEMLARICGKKL